MELFRALASLAEPPASETERIANLLDLGGVPTQAEYSDLFIFQLFPYASVYLGSEGMMGGDARELIAGFWRTLDLVPPPESDDLPVMLSFYARICELEESSSEPRSRDNWRQIRKAFLWEHLVSWLPIYLVKVTEIAPAPYRRWADLLLQGLGEEVETLGPPSSLALHLREALPLPDPRQEGGDALLDALLAPVRSGFILVRSDLQRAANKLGLGVRIGERRFVLRALLSQDAAATLSWLGEEADSRQKRYEQIATFSPVSEFWTSRAAASAALLRKLGADARRSTELFQDASNNDLATDGS